MNIDNRMFDFPKFYDWVANVMPYDCRIAEVGVADGASALYLAEKLTEKKKNFRLWMIDNMEYGREVQMQTIIKNVVDSGLSSRIEILPQDSLNASCKFPDGYFNLVFIDASHLYEPTKADIRLWIKKVRDEGYLAGHDWSCPAVHDAVVEVVPEKFKRADIPGREFDEESVLRTRETDSGYGVWYFQKQFYLTLK